MTVVVAPLSGSEKLCFREVFTSHLRVSIHGSISKLESFVMRNEYLDKVEDNASELRGIWAQWDDEAKQLFYQNYGDLPHLLDIKVDKRLFRAMVQFWNPAYSCFTFGEVDLVPTLEEYTTLLRCLKIQGNKAYVRPANLPTFMKKLMMITGMSEQWAAARIQQKGNGTCIPWKSLRDLILAHPDLKRRVDVLALSIYGLVIFPKAMRHIDEAVVDLVDRLGNNFWKVDKVPCRVFFKHYSPLKEVAATPRKYGITEERWIEILQNLREEDVMWKAPWMTPSEILYRCGSFDWGLAQSDFSYKGDHYKKKMRVIFEAWKKTEFGGCSIDGEEFMSDSIRVRGHKARKIEVEKVRKEKRKIEEDRHDLKTQYKKTQLSLKRAGLGKSLEQWQ
ncbi:hypothetical protein CXB51_013643 [Gossypium anomalum]|uniref:DUF7745 domain-containing protein n=1 Tax=Gossypium anomalum TaxID=47600 RepID=A0A8J5YIT3_9ROSI|nr:hypothetical protein CXB51_013643 [Gossypium anomalum]